MKISLKHFAHKNKKLQYLPSHWNVTLQIWLVDKRLGEVIITMIKELSNGLNPMKMTITLPTMLKKHNNNFFLLFFLCKFIGKMKKKQLVGQNRDRIYIYTNNFIIDSIGRDIPALGGRKILRENNPYKESMAATSYIMRNSWLTTTIKTYNFSANIFNSGEPLLHGHCSTN